MVKLFHFSALERKLLRDIWRMRGQMLAVLLVTMCGIATFVTMRGSYEALLSAQTDYYERYRFADVFVSLKRAPSTLLERIRAIPGISAADGRIVFDASVDVPGLDEPATARLVSLPIREGEGLNNVHLRQGRLPAADSRDEALVSEAFAQANGLKPGDKLGAIINGRKQRLDIVGIAISPEFVSEMKGNAFPDNRRFGVLWMGHDGLAAALDLREAFNDLAVALTPTASARQVIESLDILLAPYGSFGAYGREDQLSHNFLSNELVQNRVTATILPAIFLGVVAFLIHNVLLRVTALQRSQIALLKSFGYSGTTVGLHYLEFALVPIMAGGLMGIALGYWLGAGLAHLYARFYHFPTLAFSLSAFSVSVAMLCAILSALFGAVLAVRKVLKLPPAEAMRPESPPHFRPGPLERMGLLRKLPLAVRMVVRNLERHRLKSLLSVFSLAMAGALMVTGQYSFDALDEIIRLQFRTAQREDVSVTFTEARPLAVAYNLAALPGVLRVEPFRGAAVRLRYGHRSKKSAITGLVSDRELRLILDQQERPVALPEQGILLSKTLADMLHIAAGDMLVVEFLEGRRHTRSVPVAGIVDEPIGTVSYMAIDALARLMETSSTASGAFLSVDPRNQAALFHALKTLPAIGSVKLREATLQSFLATIAENLKLNTTVMVAFACVIAGGIVYNSARIALSEHAVELASLRVLGLTRAEVAGLLLGQQAVLVLAALPLGAAIGYGLAALLSWLLSQDLFRIPLVVSTRTFLLSGGAVLAAAVASGFLVWRKVQRLDLIEVLKARE